MMITSIESAGPLIVSGSTDKSVSLWDARWEHLPAGGLLVVFGCGVGVGVGGGGWGRER